MTAIEIVRQARYLIREERFWWKGFTAASFDGTAVPQYSPKAQRFCLMGALHRAYSPANPTPFEYHDALFAVLKFVPRDPDRHVVSMSSFNDRPETTHAMVLEVLDQAIAALERK